MIPALEQRAETACSMPAGWCRAGRESLCARKEGAEESIGTCGNLEFLRRKTENELTFSTEKKLASTKIENATQFANHKKMTLPASARLLLSAASRRGTAGLEAALNSAGSRAAAVAGGSASSFRRSSSSSAAVVENEGTPSTSSSSSLSSSSLALDAFRAHNSSLPGIEGSTTLAKVLRVERDFVTVDGGCLKRPVRLARSELREGQLVSSSLPKRASSSSSSSSSSPSSLSPPSLPLLRTGPSDVRVGDVLRFHVERLTSPYGDASLSAEPRPRPAQARAAAWEAVLAAAGAERIRATTRGQQASPSSSSSDATSSSALLSMGRVVHGRVLNALPTGGGYAVGVAGVVGFLPFSAAAPSTGARVGVLQRFRVTSAVPSTGSFVLEDEGAAARRVAQAKRQAAWAAARKEAGGEAASGGGEGQRGQQQQRPVAATKERQPRAKQQQQRRGRQQQQQQRSGVSEREEGWYQPSPSRR